MKKFWILWTYVANYGQFECMAKDAKEAADKLYSCFSADFKARGTIYVFEGNPKLLIVENKEIKL